ncbi:Glutamate--tRNA ligase 1 [bacterium HR17]|uniref:Glutamate--tRNA ligase n=1 Tax=Candidatus Fervidibacter japonicus TaxID=2035412 RepID=A0A2H5XA43_9BACT|nr:Glutamate--tRNA ligase 1 [bacterium HR17]
MNEVRVRIAPSPTGYLHVGTARTALFNWLFARQRGGKFFLRIEDTDRERSKPVFEQDILDGLRWLDLHWDGDIVYQSQRLALYQREAQRLLEMGKAYPCFCTPEELEQRRQALLAKGVAPKYDRRCRRLSPQERERWMREGRPYVLRFAMPLEGEIAFRDIVRGEIRFANRELDDFVIVKSDGFPTYNFACVVDDAAMGITHVIRGEDHISNTPRQLHLYAALGYAPPQFAHLPLLLGPDRSKLSKRHGAVSLNEYRRMGILPEAMVNFLALLGWYPRDQQEIKTREQLIAEFDLADVKPSGAIFDLEKLLWMNGVYIRRTPVEVLARLLVPYFAEQGWLHDPPTDEEQRYLLQVTPLVQERMRTLQEAVELAEFFYREPESYDEKAKSRLCREGVADLLLELSNRLDALTTFTVEQVEATVRQLAAERGMKAADIIHPTRAALTGRMEGPSLFHLMAVLGKERCVGRLRRAVAWLHSGATGTAQ